jgi:hypothetical protein
MPGLGLGLSLKRSRRIITPGFNPLSLSPALWYDASDLSTLYQNSGLTTPASADGDPVAGWKDKSGGGYHATQTDTTKRASLRLAIKNGKPIVRFNGSTSRLSHLLTLSAASTVVGVFNVTSAAGGVHKLVCCSPANTAIKAQFMAKITGVNQWGGYWNSFRSSGITSLNTWNIGTITDSGAGTVNMYNNGAASPVATFTSQTYYTDVTHDRRCVGGHPGGELLTGDIAEILVIPGVISAGNLASLSSYLNSKWGVY